MDHYQTLGIRYEAHPEEIERAYMILSSKEELGAEVIDIQMAYNTLISPSSRFEYDKSINKEISQPVSRPSNLVIVNRQEEVRNPSMDGILYVVIYFVFGIFLTGVLLPVIALIAGML